MTTVTAVFVVWLVPNGLGGVVAVPLLLLLGAGMGLLTGGLILLLRIPPVVVTLAMYFILGGVNLELVGSPQAVPSTWVQRLAGDLGPIPGALILIGGCLAVWAGLAFTPYRKALYAVGGNDVTAFSSGLRVSLVRVAAYSLGGAFAAVGGLALLAINASASASLSTVYTLQAIAAVTLGGTSLWGGRGGIIGPIFGAASIYLIGTLLVTFQISPSWLQVVYGAMLLVAVVLVSLGPRARVT
jgi:ribose transport system permease protein